MNKSIFTLTCLLLLFLPVTLFSASTVQLNGPSGNVWMDYDNYENNLDVSYYINTNQYLPVVIQYDVDAESICDYMAIYDVDSNGNETELLVIDNPISGVLTTTSPSGRAKIQIVTDGSVSYADGHDEYLGFCFDYYSASSYTFTQNFPTLGNASIAGNLGVGFSNPATRLHVNGPIRGNGSNGELTISTTQGSMTLGANNSTQALLSTDRSRFYMTKPLFLGTGALSALSNLSLQTNGVTRMTVLNSNGHVGIGTSAPSQALSIKGRLSVSPVDGSSDEAFHGSLMLSRGAASGQYINLVRYGIMPWSIGMVYNTSHFAIGPGRGNDADFNNPPFVINPDGNVVIGGFLDTGSKLHVAAVNGDGIRIGKPGDSGNRNVPKDSVSASYHLDFSGYRDVATDQIGARIAALRFNGHLPGSALVQPTGLSFSTNPTGLYSGTAGLVERLRILPNGHVGIGTSRPAYLLDVKGVIRATEVKIESIDAFADYVFESDYALRPLSEVESFVRDHGHLPEIPSATQVKEEGVGLVEMQVKLLKKIEELTLYAIDQQRLLESQSRVMEQQQERLEMLEKALLER